MSVRVETSEKAKDASEGFVLRSSIADRGSGKHREDIMRWEAGRALGPERLIEWPWKRSEGGWRTLSCG
jgi:hypothetical protein